jgi:RNA polymerase sigma-70 factor (ECF subfamily)
VNLFSRTKNEAAVIRRIFKGEPDAYRHIVERYQPMVYAVALANTGNVYLADKVVVETFLEGFNRLVSLADPKRLGTLLCSLAQGKADEISGKQTSEGKRPRPRGNEAPPVDLKFIQSELMEPLIEEMGSFSVRERKGLLLHTFCGMSAKQIADVLRIERKEAEEDLARTRENIERALLKEIKNALQLEVNSKERFGFIMTEVAGSEAATQAMSTFRAGKQKGKALGLVVGAAIVLVLLTAGYFGYRALKGITAVSQAQENSVVSGDNPLPMST